VFNAVHSRKLEAAEFVGTFRLLCGYFQACDLWVSGAKCGYFVEDTHK
jgi:hypothetical protein